MEDPRNQLNEALKEAIKNKDNQRRDVIRMTLSAIKQVEIDTRKELNGEEVMAVLQKEAKKRRETVAELQKAGREDQLTVESAELAVIESFLPRQLSADEVRAIAQEVIAQVGATSAKDTNKVMAPIMERVKGVADGKLVSQVVRELLS